MQEFKVNEYITLKLEDDKTIIYVAGKKFRQCKKLILNIPLTEIKALEEIKSIDEAKDIHDLSVKNQINRKILKIIPEVEFWGHCSNVQVWAEHDYDTRLLHSELAFPLLTRLVEVGDSKARKALKEEIIRRIEENYLPVIFYLFVEDYPKYYLSQEELSAILLDSNSKLKRKIKATLEEDIIKKEKESCAMLILEILIRDYNDIEAKNILKNKIIEILKSEKKDDFNYLLEIEGICRLFDEKELKIILFNSPTFLNIMKNNPQIGMLFNLIPKRMKKEKKRRFYEKLLIMVNYTEGVEDIAESINKEFLYQIYNEKKNV